MGCLVIVIEEYSHVQVITSGPDKNPWQSQCERFVE